MYFAVGMTAARNSDDVGSEDSISLEPFDLNHFFGEDGKIYGYTDLKVENKLVDLSFRR
jgi:histone acetyltransferase 1